MTERLVGRSITRREDARFLTGKGRYVDDLSLPGMLHGVFVRSPHAHARLRNLDPSAARSMPGVHLVLSAEDLAGMPAGIVPLDLPPPGEPVPGRHDAQQPTLAHDYVRYVGDPVAFIVADSPDEAREAAEAVDVEYEDLPAVIGIDAAVAGGLRTWAGSATNVVFDHAEGDAEAVADAFAGAARTVRIELPVNRVDAFPLETRGCIGCFALGTGEFTLYVSTQRVHVIQRALADRVFRVPRDRMRVIAPETGGGFGQKNGLYAEYVCCLEAARRLGRPVKWIADRGESLATNCHGRDNRFAAEAALDERGSIIALRADRVMDLGAYTAPRSMVPVLNGLTHMTGVYDIPAAHVRVRGVLTNTACTNAYRGAGRPENVFCCERLVDLLARKLSLDAIELRRRLLIAPHVMPYRSALGTTYENIDFGALLDRALAAVRHSSFPERRADASSRGRRRGLGVALYAEDLHGSEEPIPAQLSFDGERLVVLVGSGSAGHGHETSFLQIAADRLGLPIERLAFLQSDTGCIPDGVGTAASWSVTLGGSSVRYAADAAIEKARGIAARRLETSADRVMFDDGVFRLAGTNRTLDWDDIFTAEPDFHASGVFTGHGQNIPASCHACEVEVDPETGAIEIVAYAVAQDSGVLVNPMLVEGQLHGGAVQGIGQGWSEAILYDRESGQLLSGSLMDYGVPRAGDLPFISISLSETPDAANPLGVKGVGEAAATGSTAAFVNAVLDALASLGIHEIETPLTPERVWAAIAAAKEKGSD